MATPGQRRADSAFVCRAPAADALKLFGFRPYIDAPEDIPEDGTSAKLGQFRKPEPSTPSSTMPTPQKRVFHFGRLFGMGNCSAESDLWDGDTSEKSGRASESTMPHHVAKDDSSKNPCLLHTCTGALDVSRTV